MVSTLTASRPNLLRAARRAVGWDAGVEGCAVRSGARRVSLMAGSAVRTSGGTGRPLPTPALAVVLLGVAVGALVIVECLGNRDEHRFGVGATPSHTAEDESVDQGDREQGDHESAGSGDPRVGQAG